MQDLIEPPDIDNVSRSFEYLFNADMISSPDDFGHLTALGQWTCMRILDKAMNLSFANWIHIHAGRFSGALPCDLQLGRLVALGVVMGVARAAVLMVAALIQPKSLFRIASPLIHTDPDEFNDIVRTTFIGSD